MLPKPFNSAIIYEDKKLYACLANFPIVEGHSVVVWKKKVTDLHLLSKKDYLYLMNIVDKVRSAMLKTLKVKKVYLVYMDEANQVHWHLIPRYDVKGYEVFKKKPKKLTNFKLDDEIRKNLKINT
jgi:diadenosine tetraphosphate (Ap4A) HIT family hydrolase